MREANQLAQIDRTKAAGLLPFFMSYVLTAGESKVNPYDLFGMSSAMGRDGLDHRGEW